MKRTLTALLFSVSVSAAAAPSCPAAATRYALDWTLEAYQPLFVPGRVPLPLPQGAELASPLSLPASTPRAPRSSIPASAPAPARNANGAPPRFLPDAGDGPSANGGSSFESLIR